MNKCLNYKNGLFQVTDVKMINEINIIGKADIKVDSEEFCQGNDDQENYHGMRWIIICSSTVLMLFLNCYL